MDSAPEWWACTLIAALQRDSMLAVAVIPAVDQMDSSWHLQEKISGFSWI